MLTTGDWRDDWYVGVFYLIGFLLLAANAFGPNTLLMLVGGVCTFIALALDMHYEYVVSK